ncbi:MAG TPA: sulfatase-like hydrolase/transferase [Acidobacteriota bacterium]|nr:sulfatase-like hydrolase/transferase [Acidobacteriota bacterium]
MKRVRFIFLTLFTLMVVAAGAPEGVRLSSSKDSTGESVAQESVGRPNIVLIQTDDQAAWALGYAGNHDAVTPNLDRLFREGAYLRNSFVTTPVCSPSRAGLIASRYGTEVGITDWIDPKKEPDLGLDPSLVTWPKLLADAGYSTSLVGKWHLGTLDRFHPSKFGFHHFMGFRSGGAPPKDPTLEVNGELKQVKGFRDYVFTDAAIDFVRKNRNKTFLLSLQFHAPHAPYTPVAEQDWALYKDLDPLVPNPDYPKLDVARIKKLMREYLASVTTVDRNVGRLLDVLNELNLEKKTVVIFTSDHGYNIGHHGIWHKGNARWILTDNEGPRPNMFDTSLRVPTVVRWPGVIASGVKIDQTITNLDWYPTILAIAQLPRPAGVIIRGRNFLPLLRGERIDWDNEFYGEYSQHHYTETHLRMFRTPDWKLVLDFKNKQRGELYHLAEDPEETRNRIDDPASQKMKDYLRRKIVAKMRQLRDPVLRE